MIDEDKIAAELVKREKITFSELRRDFDLTYEEALMAVRRLTEVNLLEHVSGMTYLVKDRNAYKKRSAKTDGTQIDFFGEMITASNYPHDLEAVYRPLGKRGVHKKVDWRQLLLEEFGKSADDKRLSNPKNDAKTEDAEEEETQKKGKMGEGKKKPQLKFDIEPRKSGIPNDASSYIWVEDYDHWKEEHGADAKNFPENELEIPRVVLMGMKEGVCPDSYKALTVTGYDGEKFPIELTMSEDRKVMWFSISGVNKMAKDMPLSRVREVIRDYSGVKCLKDALVITVRDLKQVIGAIINLYGAYAALLRATDFF